MDNDRKVNLWKFVHDKFHELAVMRAERVAKEDEILNDIYNKLVDELVNNKENKNG